jgi:uncharacterized protein YkwD
LKKRSLLKLFTTATILFSITAINSTAAYAQWRKDNTGWWYSEGNSWSTGWRFIDSNWYFFESNGYMKTGWLLDNGIWYYLHSSGEMASDTVLIDGKYSTFDASGKWTGYLNTTNNTSSSNTLLSKAEFSSIVCDKMHELVNNHRKSNGIKELNIDKNLDQSAYLKSKHLIDNNYFAHDYSGQSFSNLVYSLSGQKINGENIAQNYLTESSYTRSSAQDLANRLFNSWKESSGHNQNMLRESFSSFGFGFEIASNGYVYATQHFRID